MRTTTYRRDLPHQADWMSLIWIAIQTEPEDQPTRYCIADAIAAVGAGFYHLAAHELRAVFRVTNLPATGAHHPRIELADLRRAATALARQAI